MTTENEQHLWEIQRIYETQLENGNRTIQLNVPSFKFLINQIAEKDAAIKTWEKKYAASVKIGDNNAEETDRLRKALEEIAEHGGINMLGKTCADVAKHALKGTGEGNE